LVADTKLQEIAVDPLFPFNMGGGLGVSLRRHQQKVARVRGSLDMLITLCVDV